MNGYWVGRSKASWHTRGTDGAGYLLAIEEVVLIRRVRANTKHVNPMVF